jgi:hypothetical protein
MNVPSADTISSVTNSILAVIAGIGTIIGYFTGHKHGRKAEQKDSAEVKAIEQKTGKKG